jgi:hypothetical protein
LVTFIVIGNSDEVLSSSSDHGVASTVVIREMNSDSWALSYCRCTADDDDFERVVLWYEESFNRLGNLPKGYITVIENHNNEWDISHYMNDEYDDYGRRIW